MTHTTIKDKTIDETQVIHAFLHGKTTGDISRKLNISRQAVCNILQRNGVKMEQGGRSLRTRYAKQKKQVQSIQRRRDAVMNKFGCSLDLWEKLRSMGTSIQETPIAEYSHGKSYAQRCGHEWLLDLESWWEVWEKSGHYAERGIHANEYCMIRINDALPYTKENIAIVTNSERYRRPRKKIC